jgi:hypothetical protein
VIVAALTMEFMEAFSMSSMVKILISSLAAAG